MKVQITRVASRQRRQKASGGNVTDKAHARAFVDGFLVTCTEGKGWDCSCLDDDCQHPDAFAALLHPTMLAIVEGEAE